MVDSGPLREVAIAVRKILSAAKKDGKIGFAKLRRARPMWQVSPSNDCPPFEVVVEPEGIRRLKAVGLPEAFVSYLDPEIDTAITELIEGGCYPSWNPDVCAYVITKKLRRLQREKVVSGVNTSFESNEAGPPVEIPVIYVGLRDGRFLVIEQHAWSYKLRWWDGDKPFRRVEVGPRAPSKVLKVVRSFADAVASPSV